MSPSRGNRRVADDVRDVLRVLKSRFWVLIGIGAILAIPYSIGVFGVGQMPTGASLASSRMSAVTNITLVFLLPLIQGMLASVAALAFAREASSYEQAVSLATSRYWVLLRAWILYVLSQVAGASLAALVTIISVRPIVYFLLPDLAEFVFPLTLIVAYAVALYLAVRLVLFVQAVLFDSDSASAALARSWNLVEDCWWRSFRMCAVLFGPSVLVLAIPFGLEFLMRPALIAYDIEALWIASDLIVASTLIAFISLWNASIATGLTMLYYELRCEPQGEQVAEGPPSSIRPVRSIGGT